MLSISKANMSWSRHSSQRNSNIYISAYRHNKWCRNKEPVYYGSKITISDKKSQSYNVIFKRKNNGRKVHVKIHEDGVHIRELKQRSIGKHPAATTGKRDSNWQGRNYVRGNNRERVEKIMKSQRNYTGIIFWNRAPRENIQYFSSPDNFVFKNRYTFSRTWRQLVTKS